MDQDRKKPAKFVDVLKEELDAIEQARKTKRPHGAEATSPYDTAHEMNLTGLAFSGGGIRSATFNLGIIQALSKLRELDRDKLFRLLPRFDYLSTVSGGGYIGAWLQGWLHRESQRDTTPEEPNKSLEMNEATLDDTLAHISTRPCGFGREPDIKRKDCERKSGFPDPFCSGFPPLEHAAIRHLRRYSNYLTPRLGLSADTLTVVSLFLRNLLVLQVALVTLTVFAVLLTYAVFALLVNASPEVLKILPPPLPQSLHFWIGAVLLLVAVGLFGFHTSSTWKTESWRRYGSNEESRAKLWGLILAIFCVFGIALTVSGLLEMAVADSRGSFVLILFGLGAVGYPAVWLLGYLLATVVRRFNYGRTRKKAGKRKRLARLRADFGRIFRLLLAASLAGVLIGGLMATAVSMLASGDLPSASFELATATFGPPLGLLAIFLAATLQMLVVGNAFSQQNREWWARIGGLVLIAALVWSLVLLVAFYGPPLVEYLAFGGGAALAALLASWFGASWFGAWVARSVTGIRNKKPAMWRKAVAKIAPWIFLLGLAVIVSWGVSAIVFPEFSDAVSTMQIEDPAPTPEQADNSEQSKKEFWKTYLAITGSFAGELAELEWPTSSVQALIALLVFLAIGWALDLNVFSAHSMYRNRLVRAYLGASRAGKRNAHPFTGFDPEDDLPLCDLAHQRPLPIINTTINMSGGDDLAWQTRRAASFSFTPHYVGYETKDSKGKDRGGYRPTREFGAGHSADADAIRQQSVKLGTAMAISGAAASPNMGYNTSPSIAALLTAFNLRLGYWAGNPAHDSDKPNAPWRKSRPTTSIKPLLNELTASATSNANWINLSDGGHFDNLGIYELVRRRCRFIVATDAGCDPKHRFQDLANTVRKCWTDLGVHIYFHDLARLKLNGKNPKHCKAHGCFGLIEYPDRKRTDSGCATDESTNEERYGLILYLKASLTESDTRYVDILQYANTHPAFPHETTADQFFDENQFEAYRHLGYCIVDAFREEIESLFERSTGQLNPAACKALIDPLRAQQNGDPEVVAEPWRTLAGLVSPSPDTVSVYSMTEFEGFVTKF